MVSGHCDTTVVDQDTFPNNLDAAFKTTSRMPKPVPTFLVQKVCTTGPPPSVELAWEKPPLELELGEMVKVEGHSSCDENDVILLCWGNTSAAKERRRKENQEINQRMEAWRQNVGLSQGLA